MQIIEWIKGLFRDDDKSKDKEVPVALALPPLNLDQTTQDIDRAINALKDDLAHKESLRLLLRVKHSIEEIKGLWK